MTTLHIPPTVAIAGLIGAYLLVGHLDYQDQVAAAEATCQAKGPAWSYSPDTGGCIKRPLPECEPARRHTPSQTKTIPEYCNHAKTR